MKQAKTPFQFMAASTLTRICGVQATNISELLEQLRRVSTDSVFNHTFQSLSAYHFLTEGFSNDFAQWALAACNAPQMAEQLAALDIRQYESVEDLRADLVQTLESFVAAEPQRAQQKAFEPFYFCEAVTVTVPTDWRAHNLREFCEALWHVSVHSIHYHFVSARLRGPQTNDFSAWMEHSLGLPELADRVEHIDIYTNTLERVRQLILDECIPWVES
ncbi:MAG: hypothetical protein HY656_04430 [Acidobacteria bacterium]|nr:hypothetical protein [Acidobacteriota bacterium]